MQQGSTMKATGGRAASRERRAQLVQGKGGMPPAAERSRMGVSESGNAPVERAAPAPAAPQVSAPAAAGNASSSAPMAWAGQRITGTLFSSDEQASAGTAGAGNHVTGDTPRNVSRVTGTQRGAERNITGASYYCANVGGKKMESKTIESVANGFSVRSPQLDSQLRADAAATKQPSAEGRITGTFARGEGKITGNQEFHFSPRPQSEGGGRSQITGEGRTEGSKITGGAWDQQSNITGTEDYIATERNPSERDGHPHAFAGASLFKGKGKHETPTQHVTGMVGWSSKKAARVTLSGGAQG